MDLLVAFPRPGPGRPVHVEVQISVQSKVLILPLHLQTMYGVQSRAALPEKFLHLLTFRQIRQIPHLAHIGMTPAGFA